MTLLFATGNEYKVNEVRSVAPKGWHIVSMREAGFLDELPETQNTIAGNSLQKAQTLFERMQQPCFSEDTGLEIDALGGAPGVHTARFAGEDSGYDDNMNKVLELMADSTKRNARFRTVITYFSKHGYFQFEGVCEGRIAEQKKGTGGFGYDPIFIPHPDRKSFAEMTLEEKNAFSHRKKAFHLFATFLKKKASITNNP